MSGAGDAAGRARAATGPAVIPATSPAAVAQDDVLVEVIDDASALECFPLIRQLRPHLADAPTWLARFRGQVPGGYRVFVLKRAGRPTAFAGFRVQENLVYGRFLYVDDLVTDAALRGGGQGAALIEALKAEAARCGCVSLVLDTAIDNVLAHRFYYRCGLLGRALRFNVRLDNTLGAP